MNHTMAELDKLFPNNVQVLDAAIKTEDHLNDGNNIIVVSVSGGSDSDVMLDMVEKLKLNWTYPSRVIYVFFNTGMEYEATKQHIKTLEQKYGIEIIEQKATIPVPAGCKKYGIPFLTKQVSENIDRLQKHGFQWEDEPLDALLPRYPKCRSALRWWCNDFATKTGKKSKTNIDTHKWLKEFLMENPPDFRISKKCCDGAKKSPAHRFVKEVGAKLDVVGVRKAEGGARSMAYSTCFSEATKDKVAQFRPLFYFSDRDKAEYEKACEIVHSDCYTKYGLKGTGCACCPFGSRFEQELAAAEWFEPKLFQAANAVFGRSYKYTREYRLFKKRMNWERKPKDEAQTALSGF